MPCTTSRTAPVSVVLGAFTSSTGGSRARRNHRSRRGRRVRRRVAVACGNAGHACSRWALVIAPAYGLWGSAMHSMIPECRDAESVAEEAEAPDFRDWRTAAGFFSLLHFKEAGPAVVAHVGRRRRAAGLTHVAIAHGVFLNVMVNTSFGRRLPDVRRVALRFGLSGASIGLLAGGRLLGYRQRSCKFAGGGAIDERKCGSRQRKELPEQPGPFWPR